LSEIAAGGQEEVYSQSQAIHHNRQEIGLPFLYFPLDNKIK
jgi:hypothetical protein